MCKWVCYCSKWQCAQETDSTVDMNRCNRERGRQERWMCQREKEDMKKERIGGRVRVSVEIVVSFASAWQQWQRQAMTKAPRKVFWHVCLFIHQSLLSMPPTDIFRTAIVLPYCVDHDSFGFRSVACAPLCHITTLDASITSHMLWKSHFFSVAANEIHIRKSWAFETATSQKGACEWMVARGKWLRILLLVLSKDEVNFKWVSYVNWCDNRANGY